LYDRTSISNQLALDATRTSITDSRSWTQRLRSVRRARHFTLTWLGVFTVVVAAATPIAFTSSASAVAKNSSGQSAAAKTLTSHDSTATYSVGTTDASQPSGVAPPTTSEIPGYRLSYVTGFNGSSVPSGWFLYSGKPSGDPSGQWAADHVTVSGGMLQLNTYQDPSYNNEWVSGGVSKYSAPHTYGAYFVRSRMTGPGPTQVEILWPVSGWPPEIDFDETYGGDTAAQATLHYTSANLQIHKNVNIDMTAWHTWGVIWTPDSITYTVDGKVWGSVNEPSIIPAQPMTLNLQQQTWCSSNYACPTAPQSTDVNWVAEYIASSTPITTSTTTTISNSTTTSSSGAPRSITLGSFANNSVKLSRTMKARVRHLAKVITRRGDSAVTLTGYANGVASRSRALSVSRQRASRVRNYLEQQLASRNDHGVTVIVIGAGDSAVTTSVNAQVDSGKVVALLK